MEKGRWTYQCEECQELEMIKRRCEDYRLQTIDLKRRLKEANQTIDKLQRINKDNNVAAKDDVRQLQRLVNDQKGVIDNFRLMLKLQTIK